MQNVIGTMILVDTAALIRDFGLNVAPGKDPGEGEVPSVDLDEHFSEKNYVVMVAPNEFSESGMGTKDMVLKVQSGDEIKWWGEPIHSNTSADFCISKIKPVNESAVYRSCWVDHFGESSASVDEGKGKCQSGIDARDIYRQTGYPEHQYRLKLKGQPKPGKEPVELRYQIEIKLFSKPGKSGKQVLLGIFRWETIVLMSGQREPMSDDVESFENQVAARFVDRDLFFTN
ncbi:MAG: AidA/PixA family protein [Marinilabilia sp.]